MIKALGAWDLHPGAGLSGRQLPLRSIISEELSGKCLGRERQWWNLDKELQFLFRFIFCVIAVYLCLSCRPCVARFSITICKYFPFTLSSRPVRACRFLIVWLVRICG